MKAETLKTIARKLDLKGRSKLRKGELENAVMSQREGRKEVYAVNDAEWANEVVEGLLTMQPTTFFLPKPKAPEHKPVSGTFFSFKDLAQASRGTTKDLRGQQKDFAAYCGKVKALKNEIRSKGYRQIRWSEDNNGFRLGIAKRQAA